MTIAVYISEKKRKEKNKKRKLKSWHANCDLYKCKGDIKMRHILIATHGLLASGARSTMEFLIGNVDNVDYITAYVDGVKPINEQIEEYFAKIPQEDEVVIFTDIKGGSVNQKMIPYCVRKNTFLVSGFNLAVLIEVTMTPEKLTNDFLKAKIEEAREQLCLVEIEKNNTEENDDDFLL